VKKVQQQKIIILSVIVIALFLSWLFVVSIPLSAQYTQITSQLDRLEKSNEGIRSLQNKLSSLRDRNNKSAAHYQDLLKKIPNRDQYFAATESIRMLTAEHNLKLEQFSPSTIPIELGGGSGDNSTGEVIIDKYPTDVGLTGGYLNFGHFLDDLEKLPYLFAVENIMLEPTKSQDSLSISIIIYTYIQRGEL